MREVTEWDRAVSFWISSAVLLFASSLTVVLSNPNLFKLHSSYGSWFHINDNKMSLHKCLTEYYILFLDKMHWVSLHLITVGHIMTLICKFSFLGPRFVHPLFLADWFIFPLSIFQHNYSTHYDWEIRTSTLKNVCCWDTWLITGLPTQFYLCR